MSARNRALAIALIACAGMGALRAMKAQAIPRYSARYQQNCALCHVNPTGGGMRTSYASRQLAPEELAWSRGAPVALAEVEPTIARHVGIGADFREVFLVEERGSPPPVEQGFFQMQGDVYLSLQPDPAYTLYFDRGMANTYEVFGVGYLEPWLYFKAGRFVPSYGWKFDDHTMLVRDRLDFFPPANSDVGVELGVSHGPLDLQVAALNGNRGGTQDDDRRVAGAMSALVRFPLGPLSAAAGASAYLEPGEGRRLDIGGLRGYLAWGEVTWVGEGDLIRLDRLAGPAVTGLVTSHELAWPLRQGLELKATYDFHDPDIDVASGAETRWGGGIHLYARSFLSIEALVRTTRVEAGPAIPGREYDEGVLQLHLLY